MKFALFYHSLISDWNHGNAHFLRGIVSELLMRGHDVRVFEPLESWSVTHLVRDHGPQAIAAFHHAYPQLTSEPYTHDLDLDAALDGVDVVIVHEWNEPELVAKIGAHRAQHRYIALFHDTHHRCVTAPNEIARYDLTHYDGVLAFGRVIRDLYVYRKWTRRAWTWHEAADVRVFQPWPARREGDLVWIGNWGDEERTAELREMLCEPMAALGLVARVYGVRYPSSAKDTLARAGITYCGWLPNFDVPDAYSRHAVTVHVPRRPYAKALPGIPTIRVFEALACGIPLVCAPWHDAEGLFSPGDDYLVAHDGHEMTRHLNMLLADPARAKALAAHGRSTILARHTCGHRVDELIGILAELGVDKRPVRRAALPLKELAE
jgi:spore maturation protein CgeB